MPYQEQSYRVPGTIDVVVQYGAARESCNVWRKCMRLIHTLVAITFMYTSAIAVYMAKLYWRLKVNGKWTWRPAEVSDTYFGGCKILEVTPLEEEEE